MRKRTFIAVVIAFALTLGVTALWSAETTGRDGDADSNVVSDTGAQTGKAERKKGGNKIARLFAAPFRAVGHLFGRGRDKNDARLERLTEKDVAKFESAGAMRVDDGRASEKGRANGSGSARDHLAAGRALLAAGRVNEAIAELSLAVSMDSRLGEAHQLLGLAYDRKGMGA
ncbi:MAG TPA: hypothetical protein VF507_03585, partial [Pyrinomonadaceae bacterium]